MIKQNSRIKDLVDVVTRKLEGANISSSLPNGEVLNKLFEVLFYTSMKTEEGQFAKVTISLIDPLNPDPSPPKAAVANRWTYSFFEKKIPFNVKNLVKLSKAADPWSSSLAVFYDKDNELSIWGMIDQAIHYQSFLNYESEELPEQAGLIQVTIKGIGFLTVMFEHELIATLNQDVLISNYIDVFWNGVVGQTLKSNSKSFISTNLNILLEEFHNYEIASWEEDLLICINESLARILLRIQNYQHGGALLITKDIKDDLDVKYKLSYSRLSNSILNFVMKSVQCEIYSERINKRYLDVNKANIPTDLYLDENVSESERKEIGDELKGAIRFISSLTCVDGLVLLTHDLKLIGFGTVIKSNELPSYVYISRTSIIHDEKLIAINPNNLGTRHRSMFAYCWNNKGSLGFVVSQDGDIRAILRVNDKLIMWENIKVQQFLRSDKLVRPLRTTRKGV